MIIGATLQTASQNCQLKPHYAVLHTYLRNLSCHVCRCEVYLGVGDSFRHCGGVFSNWRFGCFHSATADIAHGLNG